MASHTLLNLNCFSNKYNNDEKGFKSEILDAKKHLIFTTAGISEFKSKLDKLIEKGVNDILSKEEYDQLEKGLQDLKELTPYKVKLNSGKIVDFFIKAIPDKKEEEEEELENKEDFTDEEPPVEEETSKETEDVPNEEDPNEDPENQDLPDGSEIEYKGQKYVKADGEWHILGEDIDEKEAGGGEGDKGNEEGGGSGLSALEEELNSDPDLKQPGEEGQPGEQPGGFPGEQPGGQPGEQPGGLPGEDIEEKPAIPKGSKTLSEHATDTTTEDLKLFVANPHNDDSLKDVARKELEKRGELDSTNDSPLSQRELMLDIKDQINELKEKVDGKEKDEEGKDSLLDDNGKKEDTFEDQNKLKSSPDNKDQMNSEILKEEEIADERKQKKEGEKSEVKEKPDEEEEKKEGKEEKEEETKKPEEEEETEQKDKDLKKQPENKKEEKKPEEEEETKKPEDEEEETEETKKPEEQDKKKKK